MNVLVLVLKYLMKVLSSNTVCIRECNSEFLLFYLMMAYGLTRNIVIFIL